MRFTADELRELRYAALLHDFGKVGVREHVLVKSKKLYPADLDRIRQRIELLMRDLELGATRRKLDWVVRRGQHGYAEQAARLDAELAAAIAELNEALDVILTMNEPSVHVAGLRAAALADHRPLVGGPPRPPAHPADAGGGQRAGHHPGQPHRRRAA